MTTSMNRVIVLDEAAGTAVLERSTSGSAATRRLLDTKTVDMRALLPSDGALYALPPRCRFYAHRGHTAVFVTEQPPEARTIRWELETDSTTPSGRIIERLARSNLYRAYGESRRAFGIRLETQRTFRLAFPYVIEIFRFDQSAFVSQSVFYRTKPLCDENDSLCYPNLPNLVNNPPLLCVDHEMRRELSGSLAEMIATLEHSLWASTWNSDLSDHFLKDARRIPEVASPWEWEIASRRNPRFALGLPWRQHESVIGDTVRNLLETPEGGNRSFHYFAQRVTAADPVLPGHAPVAANYRRSTANALVLTDEVLRVGDEIRIAREFGRCLPGTYRVEWFCLLNDDSERRVKLAGIEAPVSIIRHDQFANGVARIPRHEDGITVGQIHLHPGTLVRFHDAAQWPDFVADDDRTSPYHQVIGTDRGPDSEILLLLRGKGGFTIAGHGGRLLPGVEVFSLDEVNERTGLIRAKEYRLPDGMRLRVGEYLFNTHDPALYRIVGFLPPTPGYNSRSARLADDESGDTDDHRIEENGAFDDDRFMALGRSNSVASVRIGKLVIRRGSRIRYEDRTVRVGRLLPAHHDRGPFARIRGIGWLDLQDAEF